MTFLLMLITTVHGQQMDNVDTNHGYLLFSDKPVQIPSFFEHQCLRINLTEIDTVADYFEEKLRTVYYAIMHSKSIFCTIR